jgi:hypothetical protein
MRKGRLSTERVGMRLRANCASDAVRLRDYLRDSGFVSYVDSRALDVVHVAGTLDTYSEQRLLVTRSLGEWERQSGSTVDVLDLRGDVIRS